MLTSWQGREDEARPLIETTVRDAGPAGQGAAAAYAHWTAAILHNGLGRYTDALAAAEQATRDGYIFVSNWAWPSRTCTLRRSAPCSTMCVAQL